MKRWMKSKQIHQYILLDGNITWQTNKLQEIRQHILEVILHKKPKKNTGNPWRRKMKGNISWGKQFRQETSLSRSGNHLPSWRSQPGQKQHRQRLWPQRCNPSPAGWWKETSCSRWSWGSTKSLADVAKGSYNCSDHVWVALPVAAIFMPKWSC